MENIPKHGSAYANQLIEEKPQPSPDLELIGIQEKGDIINYEGVLQNEFGIWIYYTPDDNNKIKKYILAINSNKEKLVNLPLIKDGIYLIQPKEHEDMIFEIKNSKISLEEINLGENQKFLFQFIPEEMTYRIICVGNGINTLRICYKPKCSKVNIQQVIPKRKFIVDRKELKAIETILDE